VKVGYCSAKVSEQFLRVVGVGLDAIAVQSDAGRILNERLKGFDTANANEFQRVEHFKRFLVILFGAVLHVGKLFFGQPSQNVIDAVSAHDVRVSPNHVSVARDFVLYVFVQTAVQGLNFAAELK